MEIAIVTGAFSGIGREIARELADTGIQVYGLGRNPDKAVILSENFHPVACDVMDIPLLTEKIKAIKKQGPVRYLINNAGVGYFGLHEEQNTRKIHEMTVTNLEVPLVLSQLLLRDLKKSQGFIINLSSVTAKGTNPHGCAYGATKAALSSFSKSLFAEVRKYGVKVITIHPDMTATSFYRNADFMPLDEPLYSLNPAEVAEAVKYAISQKEGTVITDITLSPQKHRIERKPKEID